MLSRRALIGIAAGILLGSFAFGQDRSIVVASTTSTEDSGLFGHILPLFKAKTGIDVKVIAQGTGQALDTARRGDADVVFVHARSAEEQFLAEGFSVKRYPVMYNDFILVGPKNDSAAVKGSKDILAAFCAIKDKRVPFISRGDRSGTHIAELELWKLAGIDIAAQKGSWYKDIGQGMGAALNTASATDSYLLSDRGTWLSFKNKGDLVIQVEGDKHMVGFADQPGRGDLGDGDQSIAKPLVAHALRDLELIGFLLHWTRSRRKHTQKPGGLNNPIRFMKSLAWSLSVIP